MVGEWLLVQPFQIKSFQRQAPARKRSHTRTATAASVETENRPALRDCNVGVHARTRLDRFANWPGLPFIATHFDADIFAITILPWLSFAFFSLQIVGIGKEAEALAIVIVSHDTTHTDRLQQRIVKFRCAPVGGSIFAHCD